MNLYVADLHLGHSDCIRLDHRPFADVEEMDRTLIKLWNSRVYPDDDVYVVGDFCYRSERAPVWYLRQLKGHKHLIIGNHEESILTDEKALSYFDSVDQIKEVSESGEKVVICHFPLAEWNGMQNGSWLIYDHIHANTDDTYNFMRTREHALNAGCMINSYTPGSFRELKENNKNFWNRIEKRRSGLY